MAEAGSAPPIDAKFNKDWTKGPILSNLWFLSWPMVVMESFYVVSQVYDLIWVGKLGSAAIAGVGVANIVISMVFSMDLGLIVGMRALVARHIGAYDIAGGNRAAGQAIILSAIWGTVIALTGIFLTKPILSLFGLEAAVFAEAVAYMRIMLIGWVSIEIMVMSLYAIQAAGDTITPMKIEFCLRAVHLALCPFLVLGLWIFPRLGVSGAAISNVVAQVLGMTLVLWVLFRGHTRLRPSLRDLRLNTNIIWRILKISIPALVMSLQRSFGNLILTWLIIPFGTLAVAAHSLASRIELFVLIPGMALSAGAGVLVGQNLGAGHPERAERSTWHALGLVEAFMATCSIAFLLWAESVMSIFTTDPNLVELGSIFLRIATAGYLIMAFIAVLQSCIAGAGDTIPTMIVSIAMIWLVQLPLAYLLPRVTDLGVYGLRWAIVAGTFCGTIAYVTYFRLGRWKTKKV
jgi:putative MATE family efflux protein